MLIKLFSLTSDYKFNYIIHYTKYNVIMYNNSNNISIILFYVEIIKMML